MKRKLIFFLFSFILFHFSSSPAQSPQEIMRSDQYYYGRGVSFDAREARDRALEELTEQIAVRVSKSFERKVSESAGNLDDDVKTILRTHSSANLKNVHIIRRPRPDGQIEVFCYLAKEQVRKIFDLRKQLIYDMYRQAQRNESGGNYAFALKQYYFALLLMNSIPDEQVVYQGINFTTDIPERINRIIQGMRFALLSDMKTSPREREITVKVTYAGRPAALLDFTFWDGSNQVLVEARDGLATFRLLGASAAFDELKLNIKYAYYDARDEYGVIAALWPVVDKPTFNAAKTLNLNQPVQVETAQTLSKNWDLKLHFTCDAPPADNIMRSTLRFLETVASGDKNTIRQTYQHDPFLRDKIFNYVAYNHPRPLDKTIKADINKTRSGYELRRIRMLQRYPSIPKQSTEYLVLDFSQKGELLDFNTSITENLYNRFVQQAGHGGDWANRQEIIKFIEKYRTAYLTRDIKTVDLMFAEDALILIGRKIERKPLPDNMVRYQKFSKEPDYQYLKLSKQKYLERQRRVFNQQKDIFLDFSTFEIVKKNNAAGVYGVEMRQSYNSTTYSDEGYLFLLIDFSERDPLIYVRAWQPNEWNDSALVRTANFRIYK